MQRQGDKISDFGTYSTAETAQTKKPGTHVFDNSDVLRVSISHHNYSEWVVETIWTKLAAPHTVIETSLRNSSQERNFLLQRPGGETGPFGSIAGAETALTREFGRHVLEIAALLRVSRLQRWRQKGSNWLPASQSSNRSPCLSQERRNTGKKRLDIS